MDLTIELIKFDNLVAEYLADNAMGEPSIKVVEKYHQPWVRWHIYRGKWGHYSLVKTYRQNVVAVNRRFGKKLINMTLGDVI